MDRATRLRLLMLRLFLLLGAVALLGSGAAFAVRHADALLVVCGLLVVVIVTGWFVRRGASGACAIVERLDRVLPSTRRHRTARLERAAHG